MDVESYGEFSVILAYYGLLLVVATMGLDKGVSRFIAYYKEKEDTPRVRGTIISALKIGIPITIAVGLISYLAAGWISENIFHSIQIAPLLQLIAIVLPIDVARSVFMNVIRGFRAMKYEVITRILAENIAKLLLTVILLALGYGIFGAIIAYMIAVICSFILAFYYVDRKIIPFVAGKLEILENKREIFVFSAPVVFTGLATYFLTWTDTFMLRYYTSATDVGIYNIATPLAQLLSIIPVTIAMIFLPTISAILATGTPEEMKRIARSTNKWTLAANLLIFLWLTVFGTQIIRVIFGEQYINAYPVLLLLSPAFLIFFQMYYGQAILLAHKKSNWLLKDSIIAFVTNILLNSILIPRFGIRGAAVATSISFIILGILFITQSYKLTRIDPLHGALIKIIISGMITASIGYSILKYVAPETTMLVLALILATSLVYGTLFLLTGAFDSTDREMAKMLLLRANLKIETFSKSVRRRMQ